MSLTRRGRAIVRQVPWVPIVLLAGVLVVYLLTLAPGVLGGDPGEYQFVPYILSMAHPTGTPAYILLAKMWSALPLGPNVAWRMSLLAAVSASLATVVIYQHLLWQTRRVVPSLAAALSLGFGSTFWEQATMADKYAFNALLVALVVCLALRWGKTRSPTTLSLLVLTYGLSLTHHRTMVLFAPTLLAYVWWYERGALWRDWRRLLRLTVLLLVPLLLYLYLPWAEARNLPPGTWHPKTLGDWITTLYEAGWIREVRVVPGEQSATLAFYANVLRQDFTWAGIVLALAGVIGVWRRRWPDALFLLANFMLQAILAANYHVPRQWVFFLPSFVILAIWIGEGLGLVWNGLERLAGRWGPARHAATGGLVVAMLALSLVPFPGRYRPFRDSHLGAGTLDIWRQTLKEGHTGDRLGSAIASVARNAIIVCDWEQATPLWYYQQVEGWRPDVEIVYPMERLEEAAASGRPLYLARTYAGLAPRWHPSVAGPLIALQPEPALALAPGISPLDIQLGDSFELAGYSYGQTGFYPGAVVPLTLHWRALQTPPYDYSVSLRLFNAQGQEVAKVDSQHPVLGTYPTSLWTAGEVVADYYEIQLPTDLPPGSYYWGVILYRTLPEGGWQNLKVDGTDAEVARGGTIDVRAR